MKALVSEETEERAVSVGKCEISNLGEVYTLFLLALKLEPNKKYISYLKPSKSWKYTRNTWLSWCA